MGYKIEKFTLLKPVEITYSTLPAMRSNTTDSDDITTHEIIENNTIEFNENNVLETVKKYYLAATLDEYEAGPYIVVERDDFYHFPSSVGSFKNEEDEWVTYSVSEYREIYGIKKYSTQDEAYNDLASRLGIEYHSEEVTLENINANELEKMISYFTVIDGLIKKYRQTGAHVDDSIECLKWYKNKIQKQRQRKR